MTALPGRAVCGAIATEEPGIHAVAALTLALGVGANAAIFSVVNTVMLRPLPFTDPDGLVRIWESNVERGRPTFAVSHPNFLDFRAQATSVSRWRRPQRGIHADAGQR